MHRTIDAGPATLAAGGLLLLVSLFLPWYDGESAWASFEALDLLLAGMGLAAIALGTGRVTADGRLAIGLALAAVAIVAIQLIDPPPVVGAHVTRDTGGWLALVAGGLMSVGAVLTVTSVSISVDVRERDRRRRVAAVDRRQADGPPPAAAASAGVVVPPGPAATEATASAPTGGSQPPRLLGEPDDQRTQAMPIAAEEDE